MRPAGGGCDVCRSGACAVGAQLDVAAIGRKYGLLRRPSKVLGHVDRPGVGEGWTDGCCCRGGVVDGVDGAVVWCVLRSVGERVGVGYVDCVVPTPVALTVAPNLEVPLRTRRCRGSQGALLCQPARNRNRHCYCRPLA